MNTRLLVYRKYNPERLGCIFQHHSVSVIHMLPTPCARTTVLTENPQMQAYEL